jgi:hypothetical protein
VIDDDEPVCGEQGCTLCPTVGTFAQWQIDQYRRDRQAANEILGLPRDFGLEPIDG